ncbi:hypothetical protein AKJ09_01500 [Labilithrix luteola]|uniref:Uncharacterized protein n=1 Tax=Labilithrix luteola TaxID=1391654 RepID=A0A0K1PN69_9BACT|nr:hypothetical protein AKJ09_01500 [Labilithrix luteola]
MLRRRRHGSTVTGGSIPNRWANVRRLPDAPTNGAKAEEPA